LIDAVRIFEICGVLNFEIFSKFWLTPHQPTFDTGSRIMPGSGTTLSLREGGGGGASTKHVIAVSAGGIGIFIERQKGGCILGRTKGGCGGTVVTRCSATIVAAGTW
jgi:hypothetical protein